MHTLVIWKYVLELVDVQKVQMPRNAKILSVAKQGDIICLWAMVNPEVATTGRDIAIVGTGNPCWCSGWDFVGTVVDEPFVWHIFAGQEE